MSTDQNVNAEIAGFNPITKTIDILFTDADMSTMTAEAFMAFTDAFFNTEYQACLTVKLDLQDMINCQIDGNVDSDGKLDEDGKRNMIALREQLQLAIDRINAVL